MSEFNDGGPAFPREDYQANGGKGDLGQEGMSLRDYFAAKAMAALHKVYWDETESYESGAALIKCMAESAYETADAMLAARDSVRPK